MLSGLRMRTLGVPIASALLVCLVHGQTSPTDQVAINAPYVTSPPQVVNAMLDLAQVRSGDMVYDLGCGDGRIVISAARRYGARGVGIDINPERIEEARANAAAAGVNASVKFEVADVLTTDLQNASVVALYLLPELNMRLRSRLMNELKPGTRVVSHSFDMGDWKPDKDVIVDGNHLYLWTIPSVRR